MVNEASRCNGPARVPRGKNDCTRGGRNIELFRTGVEGSTRSLGQQSVVDAENCKSDLLQSTAGRVDSNYNRQMLDKRIEEVYGLDFIP